MFRTTGVRLALVAMLALVAPMVGCASSGDGAVMPAGAGGPDWIDSPQIGVYDTGGEQWIYGWGVADRSSSINIQVQQARARARTELARSISTAVESMLTDYTSTNRDFFDDMDNASALEMTESISRQITDQTLKGSRQMDGWRDPVTGERYILYGMRIDEDFYSSYKQRQMDAFARYAQRQMIKAEAAEYEAKLDEQLDKYRSKETEQMKDLLGLVEP